MKIKIDETGYENYTGRLGIVDFVDGVSVNDVSLGELNRMSAVIRVVSLEDGKQVGTLANFEQSDVVPFVTETPSEVAGDENTGGEGGEGGNDDKTGNEGGDVYTQEELETVADKDGIEGLREIADPLGVTDKSIKGLITKILEAQTK